MVSCLHVLDKTCLTGLVPTCVLYGICTVYLTCILPLQKMKIVIFGSTGMTGLCAVEAAVKKGIYNIFVTYI